MTSLVMYHLIGMAAAFIAGYWIARFFAPEGEWTRGYREALLCVQKARQVSRDYGDTRAGSASLDLLVEAMITSCDKRLGYRK